MPQPPPRSLPSPGAGRRCSRRVPQHPPHPRQGSLPWGRVCRGTVPCPGGRLTSPWRCRFNRCCCWSCCICRSCCWKASCLFPNGCRETKGRNQSTLFPASQQKPRKGGRGSAARDARGGGTVAVRASVPLPGLLALRLSRTEALIYRKRRGRKGKGKGKIKHSKERERAEPGACSERRPSSACNVGKPANPSRGVPRGEAQPQGELPQAPSIAEGKGAPSTQKASWMHSILL